MLLDVQFFFLEDLYSVFHSRFWVKITVVVFLLQTYDKDMWHVVSYYVGVASMVVGINQFVIILHFDDMLKAILKPTTPPSF